MTQAQKRVHATVCGRPPIGKGFLSASATLVGAAMCPTCLRGTQSRWPNAIRVSGPDHKLALEVLGRIGFS